MTIPARFTDDLIALHRLIAREEIFKDASFNMVSARFTVGCRRTFIEGPTWGSIAGRDRLSEDRVLFPESEDLVLGCWQVDGRGESLKSAHSCALHDCHPFL